MALRFLGKDPDSGQNGCPSIYDDGDSYVIQGWTLDHATRAQLRDLASNEDAVRIPKRMMALFPEVSGK